MKRQKQKQKQRQIKFNPAVVFDGENVKFLPVSGSSVIVEYPDTWPAEVKRLTGTVKMINDTTGNVYLWCDQTFQYFGINYKTGPAKGIKILVQEIVESEPE